MTSPAGVHLRRLVESTVRLSGSSRSGRTTQHPLGYGLRKGHTYSLPSGPVPLPASESSMANLRTALSVPPDGLPDVLHRPAWEALLGRPPMLVPLEVSDTSLAAADVPVGQPTEHFRQVALGAVFALDPESRADIDVVASSAILTVRLHPSHSRRAVDAWLQARWAHTTRAFSGALERLIDLGAPRAAGTSSALLLFGMEARATLSPNDQRSVDLAGSVFGFDFTVIDRAVTHFQDIERQISGRSPVLIVALGPDDHEIATLRAKYHNVAPKGTFRVVDTPSSSESLQLVRELLARVSGVHPALTATARDTSSTVERRPPLPISSVLTCKHDESERFYLRDEKTGLWWTRDTAGHAEAQFKTYTRKGGTLHHEACRDAEGIVIDKWKSDDGLVIEMSSLHGCPAPQGHLG